MISYRPVWIGPRTVLDPARTTMPPHSNDVTSQASKCPNRQTPHRDFFFHVYISTFIFAIRFISFIHQVDLGYRGAAVAVQWGPQP